MGGGSRGLRIRPRKQGEVMATIYQHEELVRRALRFILERMQEDHRADPAKLLDEAGARFNLSPNDQESLLRLLAREKSGPSS